MAYQTRLTPIGLSKQSAFISGGSDVSITHVALGDQNGAEAELVTDQANILNEVYRAAVSAVYTDPNNSSRKVVELVVPVENGGFWMREAAVIDSDGDVIAVANVPSTFKPIPASGSSRLLTVRLGFTATNSAAFTELIMDGSTVYATRSYMDAAMAALPDAWSDSDKLGGELPSHYATASSVTTLSDTVAAFQGAPTGVEFGYWGTTAPTGYVLASGRTIGSAASGATERANADTEALFTLLWTSGANTTLPIQTSAGGASTRGASAAADFAANKRMTLPDLRGRVGVGRDDMGGAAASRMTTAGSGVDGLTLGAVGGAQTHTLTSAQIPAHTHTATTILTTDGAHTHDVQRGTGVGGNTAVEGLASATGNVVANAALLAGNHTHTATTTVNASTGGDGTHNNTQPSIVRNVIIKL